MQKNNHTFYRGWVDFDAEFAIKKEKLRLKIIKKLVEIYGRGAKKRIVDGVDQVVYFWEPRDGTSEECMDFCVENFILDKNDFDMLFFRMQERLEFFYGHLGEIDRVFDTPTDVETGDILDIDYLFSEYNSFAHIAEDMFMLKIAFIVLLNFSFYKLADLLKMPKMSRRKWAELRMAGMFSNRIPAEIDYKCSMAIRKASIYTDKLNFYTQNIIADYGRRLMPEDTPMLQSHWGLRDKLKLFYFEKRGLYRQRMLYELMIKIIKQEVPLIVIDNPNVVWRWSTGEVIAKGGKRELDASFEPNTRYANLLDIFKSELNTDSYYDMDIFERNFDDEMELFLKDVEKLIEQTLRDPVYKDIATIIRKRLGRKLYPFDFWYEGFKNTGRFKELDLDEITFKKYPNTEILQKDLPNIFSKLGFKPSVIKILKTSIVIDSARGAGHARSTTWRKGNVHLRVRFTKKGLRYNDFKVFMHELGHCAEMTLNSRLAEYYSLSGLPNTAFSEGFAFIFEERNMGILELEEKDPLKKHYAILDLAIEVFEMAGLALLDIKIWQWMYKNKEASPEELKNAVIEIAINIWDQYFAPIFKVKGQPILAIYSHIFAHPLYMSEYFIGLIARYQIEYFLRNKNLAEEVERMCKIGNILPNLWMKQAVGRKISAKPLIDAATRSSEVILKKISNKKLKTS